MMIKLTGGKVYDPANKIDGEVRDIYVSDGRIVAPAPEARIDQEHNLKGKVVMAGAIDPHTHIGGGKVTIARTLMPEDHFRDEVAHTAITRAGTGHALPSTMVTGYRYAEMGYTACFEPAMLPANARQAHLEMGDTPLIDKGAFVMLGSDDFMLRLISEKKPFELIKDYIAWTMHAAQAIAVKVVNPGGISAFKFNQRKLDLDEKHVYYGITPRDIILTLARGLLELGVTHPLHVHGCNLGIPGNVETTLATIRATEGLPLHLTHIQFHSYGIGGDRHFSSGAAQIAELLKKYPHISIDVGQVLFGKTCTASGDSMRQYNGSKNADPKRWVVMDIECDAGCGVVPFRYRDKSFVHSLQWAIGLEMFLLCEDPWRIFLTTDHPNGAPFFTYPHLIRLLMDRGFRKDMMQKVHPEALKMSTLPSLDREYSLYEVAIMTRAGPAKSLGPQGPRPPRPRRQRRHHRLHRRGRPREDVRHARARVQERRDHRALGKVVKVVQGATHVARPQYDKAIEKPLKEYFDSYHTVRMENFRLHDDEIIEGGRGQIIVQPTKARTP